MLVGAQPHLLRHVENAERVSDVVLARTRVIQDGVTELTRRGAVDDGLVSYLFVPLSCPIPRSRLGSRAAEVIWPGRHRPARGARS